MLKCFFSFKKNSSIPTTDFHAGLQRNILSKQNNSKISNGFNLENAAV